MLNELLVVERGARQAGIAMSQRHPDIKDARTVPTLLILLDERGCVASVRPVPHEVTPWTLRDGQHNSFPFMQPKLPLLDIRPDDDRRRIANDKKNSARRTTLLDLAGTVSFNDAAFKGWPGSGLLKSLRKRVPQIESLRGTEASVLPSAIDRFLLACDPSGDRDPIEFLREATRQLLDGLQKTADGLWLDIASALLVGKPDKCEGALLFDAQGEQRSVIDPGIIAPISEAMRVSQKGTGGGQSKRCGLTGRAGLLVEDKFPQPNLPILGQTFLFARNRDTPANGRYGRSAADTMPVGQEIAIRLAAAFKALTEDEFKGKSWRGIPGEAPEKKYLLLAFVDTVPEAVVADALAEDDLSAEAHDTAIDQPDSVALFKTRTERVIDAVRAKVKADFTKTPVRLVVLRAVDPANRKVVYAGEVPVKDYHKASSAWVSGERNVPPWLQLSVVPKGERKPRLISPPHIAPLGVIAFSRQLFLRGGAQRQEVMGLPASEAMGLFLDDDPARARRFLKVVLSRRTKLVSGTAHALCRGLDAAREFDRREALRTVTLLGVLLHKLGRHAGVTGGYMSDIAFKLGQLLAASDVVHAGYCADVRGGALPPSLLGNQVFAMAQTSPAMALATLCRRWKPYEGWVQKALRERAGYESLRKQDERRYWDIQKALRHSREMRPLASEIAPALEGVRVGDVFRAELLLGYLAGLPRAQKVDGPEFDEVSSDQS